MPRPFLPLFATAALLLAFSPPAGADVHPTDSGNAAEIGAALNSETPVPAQGVGDSPEVVHGAPIPAAASGEEAREREPIHRPFRLPFSNPTRVIPPGLEGRFVDLILPHTMGTELDGWTVGNIEIEQQEVRYHFDSTDSRATLTLRNPEGARGESSISKNFALYRQCRETCPDILDRIEEAIHSNDHGVFWTTLAPTVETRNFISKDGFIHDLLFDGVIHILFGLLLLAAVLWRQLGRGPLWVPLALLAIVLLGALLRWWLAVEAPMTAWPYERMPPIVTSLWRGQLLPWFTSQSGAAIPLVDLIFHTNFFLAVITPLAVFAHARYLLGDYRFALAAAFLLAILPTHIRASRSDMMMVQSLAMASLTFIVIYTALLDRSTWIRLIFLFLIPLVSVATYRVRPENFGLAFIDLMAVYVVADKGVPRRRQILVGSVIASTAGYVFFREFLVSQRELMAEGLSLWNVFSTIWTFIHPRLNTFINPFVTPPWVLLLAILGIGWLIRSGQPKRAAFILLWFFGYLFIHSIIQADATAMQARYHLQLVTPFLMLAAAATPVVLEWNRRRKAVLVSLLVLSPLLYTSFIRDTNYYEMEEFAFLREASSQIPDGCTVFEFSPVHSRADRGRPQASRLKRFALQMAGGKLSERFQTLNPGVLPDDGRHEVPTRQAHDLMRSPPECLVVYDGLTCLSHRPSDTDIAPVCGALRQGLVATELLAETTFSAQLYDGTFLGRAGWDWDGPDAGLLGIYPGDTVNLRLYRAGPIPVAATEELH